MACDMMWMVAFSNSTSRPFIQTKRIPAKGFSDKRALLARRRVDGTPRPRRASNLGRTWNGSRRDRSEGASEALVKSCAMPEAVEISPERSELEAHLDALVLRHAPSYWK